MELLGTTNIIKMTSPGLDKFQSINPHQGSRSSLDAQSRTELIPYHQVSIGNAPFVHPPCYRHLRLWSCSLHTDIARTTVFGHCDWDQEPQNAEHAICITSSVGGAFYVTSSLAHTITATMLGPGMRFGSAGMAGARQLADQLIGNRDPQTAANHQAAPKQETASIWPPSLRYNWVKSSSSCGISRKGRSKQALVSTSSVMGTVKTP
jgi:hypothetical protein